MPFTARRPRSCLPRRAHSHEALERPCDGLTLAGNGTRAPPGAAHVNDCSAHMDSCTAKALA
eukprot:2570143-Prymnesium_polylepis.1